MDHNNILKQILIAVSDEKLNYAHTVELVKFSRIIVTSFLKNKKQSSLLFAYKNGIDINDLALDTIADLFEKGPDDKFYKINNFISSLRLPLEDINPSELFHAYYSFVVKLSTIQLARIYSSYDPNGQRIKKNIRETITQLENFEVYKYRQDTILFLKNCKSDGKLNYLPHDEFEKQFLSLAIGRKSTKDLLEIVYNILLNQDIYRKEIKLNDVVTLFKSYHSYAEESIADEGEYFPTAKSTDTFVDKYEIEQIRNKVFLKTKEKVFVDYFAKGKLNREQAIGLVNAIGDITSDWVETGQSDQSYYQYLSKYIELNKEEYKLCFKAKLEYLIKETKKQMAIYFDTKY